MERISSGQTFFMKRVFPFLWMGFLVVFIATAMAGGHTERVLPFLAAPALMLILGFVLFRKLLWNLADAVDDHGTYLIVRCGSIEERIELANIININMSQNMRPPRLTLRLRRPCAFGDEVAFIPKSTFGFNPLARNEIAEKLIHRIDTLRNSRSNWQ